MIFTMAGFLKEKRKVLILTAKQLEKCDTPAFSILRSHIIPYFSILLELFKKDNANDSKIMNHVDNGIFWKGFAHLLNDFRPFIRCSLLLG